MQTRFTFRQLEYLVAVGEAGSVAAATEKVNVSSPSISAAISQLEAELGVQLFIRQHAHGLSLTPGGSAGVGVACGAMVVTGPMSKPHRVRTHSATATAARSLA